MSAERYGYERLVKKYGGSVYSRPSDKSIENKHLGLPEYLISIWSDIGFSCHSDGFICFIDPNDYISIINSFLGTKTGLIPFARNSFGKIFAYKEGKYYIIDLYDQEATLIAEMDMDDFLAYGIIDSSDADYKKHTNLVKKLGIPSSEQIFAHYPLEFNNNRSKKGKESIVNFKEFSKELIKLLRNQ